MYSYSTQALTYLILIIITSLINLICYSLLLGIWGFVAYLLYILITIPFVILWMYNINCLTYGDCQIWSWVITTLTLISVLTTTILLVAIATNPSFVDSLSINSKLPISVTQATIATTPATIATITTPVTTTATTAATNAATTAATPATTAAASTTAATASSTNAAATNAAATNASSTNAAATNAAAK